MRNTILLIVLVVLVQFVPLCMANTAPVVSDVTASQRVDGSGIVEIYYWLSDADGDVCTVSVLVSDDGGDTWTITPTSFTPNSDIGEVTPGVGAKKIIWYSKVDLPGVYGTNYRVKVTADDGHIPGIGSIEFVDIPGKSWQMSKYEITNQQYCDYSGTTPPLGKENHPVVNVSWNEAKAFCDHYGYRLPTEAEWEYAARGGLSGMNYPWGNTIDSSHANYNRNVGGTTEVGSYPAGMNNYGLYDMAGNACEWTVSWYSGSHTHRVFRGGAWSSTYSICTVFYRHGNPPGRATDYLGFRVCR